MNIEIEIKIAQPSLQIQLRAYQHAADRLIVEYRAFSWMLFWLIGELKMRIIIEAVAAKHEFLWERDRLRIAALFATQARNRDLERIGAIVSGHAYIGQDGNIHNEVVLHVPVEQITIRAVVAE